MANNQLELPPGALAFSCEGNTNPKSNLYVRKLSLSTSDQIIIGRGYVITGYNQQQIVEDFTAIGFPDRKIQMLTMASQLRGTECKRFIKACKNDIILTAEQDIQLFEILYSRYNEYLTDVLAGTEKRYGKIERSKIEPYQWEVLIDFLFTGDLHSNNQDILLTTLRRSIKLGDPRSFEYLITDINYWKKAGIEEDRAKMRAVFVKEWHKYRSKFFFEMGVISY